MYVYSVKEPIFNYGFLSVWVDLRVDTLMVTILIVQVKRDTYYSNFVIIFFREIKSLHSQNKTKSPHTSSYTLFGYVAIAPATIAFHAFLSIACVRVFVSMSFEICATHVGFGLPTGRLVFLLNSARACLAGVLSGSR